MYITRLLKQFSSPQFSLEILPKAGESAAETLLKYEPVFHKKPLFADIPYHAGRSHSGFAEEKHSVFSARPKTIELAEMLIKEYGIMPQPHILCAGFSREETEKTLLQLHETGVRNLLLLRGDIHAATENKATQHTYAFQLVEQVKKLNAGINFRGENRETKTDFCIGVAGYPEPLETDFNVSVQYLKQKIDAGADFIITQLFFDNAMFFRFESACRAAGITVPIIPGISPLVSLKLLQKLPGFFKVSVPNKLQEQVKSCSGKVELEAVGVNWAVEQAKELYENEINCVHFFALSRPEILEQVLQRLYN